MKKLVYLAAVAFAASMVACGGSDANKAADADSTAVVEEAVEVVEVQDSVAPDSVAADTVAAPAEEVK